MDFGPRKNTERDVEEVLEVAKRFKAEDEVEKRRLTEKFDLQVLIEREKHTVSCFLIRSLFSNPIKVKVCRRKTAKLIITEKIFFIN